MSRDPVAVQQRDFENPSCTGFVKKEHCSMTKHRGLLWSLGLVATMGLMAGQANAGSITMFIDLDGVNISGPFTSSSPDQTLTVPVAAVNAALAAHGSAYRFTTLGAQSNYTGLSTGGSLQTNFQVNTSGTGTTAQVLSIDTTQSGFLLPTGPGGMVVSTAGGSFNTATGSVSYTSDYQGANTPTLVFPVSGTNSYKGTTGGIPVGSVPSSYELSNHFLISIAKTSSSLLGGTGGVVLTAAVPEPTSVVLFMTSLPLGLIGMVHYRRRALSKG